MIHSYKIALAAVGVALALHASPTLASPQTEVVEQFNGTLLSLFEGGGDFQSRFDTTEPAVKKAFDLGFMASKVLGRRGKDLTPEQKAEWLATFTRLTASNYAGRFVGEKGPSFETLGEEDGTHDTVVVRTQIVTPGKDNTLLTYRLRETPNGWKVIDCYLNGTVSEIALRRSEYGAVLRRDGFEALVKAVNSKSEQLAAGPPE
ncbi:MAG: ABC transporter substrate-binding protein [Candidatus Binatia bacterium]|nr:ABC transporter substrate-binding protein [Candidatus Binatia bacterium]